MEAGESVSEACQREVLEETGLAVRIVRLVGVYSNRDLLVEYPDGNQFQIVVLNFEAGVIGGELRLSKETTECGFYDWSEIQKMELLGHHKERIAETMARRTDAYIR